MSDFFEDNHHDSLVNFDAQILRTVAAKVNKADAKASEAKGYQSDAMGKVDDSGFNKQPFKQANKLANMEPSKAQEYIKDLLSYCLVMGVFDQLDLFRGEETLRRLQETVAILNDRAGELGIEVHDCNEDEETQEVAGVDEGWDEDSDIDQDGEETEGYAAEDAHGAQVVDDEGADISEIDDMPENSGAIFNAGKQHAIDEGALDDCPYDGRTKDAAIWKRGFNTAMDDTNIQDEDAGYSGGLGQDEPFPGDDAHVH